MKKSSFLLTGLAVIALVGCDSGSGAKGVAKEITRANALFGTRWVSSRGDILDWDGQDFFTKLIDNTGQSRETVRDYKIVEKPGGDDYIYNVKFPNGDAEGLVVLTKASGYNKLTYCVYMPNRVDQYYGNYIPVGVFSAETPARKKK